LNLFDKAYKALSEPAVATAARVSSPAVSANAKKFADQFLKARQFLAPLFPPEDGVAAGYDLNIEFRANIAEENEGSKIIDWALTSGTQTLRMRDTAKTLYWEPGQPVSLSLRVAKDSPLAPKPDAKQSDLSIDERTVTYRSSDPWALFSFIAGHRDPDRSGRGDGRSQLLRFEFPMAGLVDDGKPVLLESQARVFVRIGLSPVGKKTLLTWPAPFPVKAPDWSTP
jgi:type VI secretion system protein ImpL